jgi:hypothetical protein
LREATVFTGTETSPCEVECDECAVRKRYVHDPYLGQLVGTWHYAFFGMKQRGSRRGVVYTMQPRFVPASKDGKPSAPPPPTAEELGPWIVKHVGDWVVLHVDGAQAYPAIMAEVLKNAENVYLDSVDHSSYQFTRFHRHTVPGRAYPQSRIRVTAGTQLIEQFWNQLKHHAIPEEAPVWLPLLEQHALALLWRSYADGDPVEDLGEAMQSYMKASEYVVKTLKQTAEDAELQAALNAWLLPADSTPDAVEDEDEFDGGPA